MGSKSLKLMKLCFFFCIFQTPKPLFDVFNLDYIPHYIIYITSTHFYANLVILHSKMIDGNIQNEYKKLEVDAFLVRRHVHKLEIVIFTE